MERGFYHPTRGYWQTTGKGDFDIAAGTVEVPLKPGAGWDWDGAQWVEIPRDPAAELAAWRETARVPKSLFCERLMDAQILTPTEAVSAAQGGWPVAFGAALEGLPEAEAARARLQWAAATTVKRNHPMIATLAGVGGLTVAAVDELFESEG